LTDSTRGRDPSGPEAPAPDPDAGGPLRNFLEHPGELGRREAQMLAALGVHLAPPAERGAGCLHNAVLARLGGRPITADPLRRLLGWPWWGNFVELDRKLLAANRGRVAAVIVNSGNANAGTGATGYKDAQLMGAAAGDALGIDASQGLVCSTGNIGTPRPKEPSPPPTPKRAKT